MCVYVLVSCQDNQLFLERLNLEDILDNFAEYSTTVKSLKINERVLIETAVGKQFLLYRVF